MSDSYDIVYIGNFTADFNNAASSLVLNNARLLKECGYNVLLIGNTKNNIIEEDYFYTFKCIKIPFKKSFKDFIEEKTYIRTVLKKNINLSELKFLISYSSPMFSTFLFKIQNYIHLRNKSVKFISNIADLSSVAHGSYITRPFRYFERLLRYYYIRNNTDGIIVVTDFLKKHFSTFNKRIIVLPPLRNQENFKENIRFTNDDEIIFNYSGLPFPIDGRKVSKSAYKDRLDLLISYFFELKKKNITNFKFEIYGISKNQYLKVRPQDKDLLNLLSENIIFGGIKDHFFVKKKVHDSHFTINHRVSNQMTNAGFSTKFVESFAMNIPVINSLTGDVEKYLVNDQNGYIFSENDHKYNISLLSDLLTNFNSGKYYKLKQNINKEACFNINSYKSELNNFMSNL